MKFFKSLWQSIRQKNEVQVNYPEIDKDNTAIGWNIYTNPNITRAEYAKKYTKVHTGFKHKIIVPGLLIAKRFFLPKYKHVGAVDVSTPELKMWNRELIIWEQSFNEAMGQMVEIYEYNRNLKIDQDNNLSPGMTTKNRLEQLHNDDEFYIYMKTIKQGLLSIASMDGFYHEYLVLFSHTFTKNMFKEFNGETYNRILYDSINISDPNWLMLQKQYYDNEMYRKKMEELKCQEIETRKQEKNLNNQPQSHNRIRLKAQ